MEAAVRKWVEDNPDSIDAVDEDKNTPMWAMVMLDELATANWFMTVCMMV